jgi:hypothetical protein
VVSVVDRTTKVLDEVRKPGNDFRVKSLVVEQFFSETCIFEDEITAFLPDKVVGLEKGVNGG